ncbi:MULTISPECIES: hypothetical protein [unclassified Modestobacter]
MEPTDLHDRLHRLADRAAPPPRHDLADAVVTRHRAQRRQALALTAVAAVVAGVVGATPLVLDGPPAAPISATGAGPASTAAAVDVLAGPTRGSLAGDADFVEAVRQLPWDDGVSETPDAPVDTRRVVFAGDVPGGRWALVAGENDAKPVQDDPALQTDLGALSDVAIAWFAGPPGASPDQLELVGVPRGVDPRYPQALSDSVTGALVVITASGDEVEFSPRPDIAADGTGTRTWQPVDAPDGVAVLDVPPSEVGHLGAVRYRVFRGGDEITTTGPDGRGRDDRTSPEVPLTWLRPEPSPAPGDGMRDVETEHLLTQLGLPVDDVVVAVPWAGDVPGPHDRTARVTVLAVTVPSGAVYVSTVYGYETGTEGVVVGSTCGSEILPAGKPSAQRTIALRCDVTDGTASSDAVSSLVVLSPADAVSARALDPAGEVLAEFPLTDGVTVVPAPERTATVETLTADGTVRDTARPLTFANLGD